MYTSLKRAVRLLLRALAFYGFCNPSMADPILQPTSTPIVLGQQYSISSIFNYIPDKAPNGSPVLGVIAGFLPSPGVTFSGLPLHFDGFYLYCVAGDTTKLAAPCSSSGTVVFTSPTSITGSLQFWYLQDPTNPNSGFVQSDPANYTFNFGPAACHTNVTRLSQGDPRWASDPLDHSFTIKIADKGCALTSLSMALNAAGLPNDPGGLNSFMIVTDTDYYGLDVNWGPATRDFSSVGID